MKQKKITYIEITKLDTLVKMLGNDDAIVYYKKGIDNYVPWSKHEIVNNSHKHLVYLIRQSKLFYSYI